LHSNVSEGEHTLQLLGIQFYISYSLIVLQPLVKQQVPVKFVAINSLNQATFSGTGSIWLV